jgi:hypothetical protein
MIKPVLASAAMIALSAIFCTAPSASLAANFGDQVVACMVSKGVTKAGPAFDAARPGCEREVERARRITAIDDAKTAWQVCVMKQIAKIDDGISTASDVATAVQDDCEPEHEVLLGSTSLSDQVKALQRDSRRAATKELAISLVFKVRQWRSTLK